MQCNSKYFLQIIRLCTWPIFALTKLWQHFKKYLKCKKIQNSIRHISTLFKQFSIFSKFKCFDKWSKDFIIIRCVLDVLQCFSSNFGYFLLNLNNDKALTWLWLLLSNYFKIMENSFEPLLNVLRCFSSNSELFLLYFSFDTTLT